MGNYKYISVDDTAITYFGRWEKRDGRAIGNWNNPYVRFIFTGTSLKCMFCGGANIEVNIDGEVSVYSDLDGVKELCSGLENKEHNATLTITNAEKRISFGGMEIDADAEIKKQNKDRKYIQFIGDSITTSPLSYSYTIPKEYGYDYSIISMNGISLMDGAGWYFAAENLVWSGKLVREDSIGMESAYFCFRNPKDGYSLKNDELVYENPEFDVENDHQPDVIVIGIGTNDNDCLNNNREGYTKEVFEKTYTKFINKLLNIYPDAEICVLQNFNYSAGDYALLRETTKAACKAVNSPRLHHVDTTDWQVEISGDDVHPSHDGYATLRDLVYNKIKPWLT